jgi:hypothetical protein
MGMQRRLPGHRKFRPQAPAHGLPTTHCPITFPSVFKVIKWNFFLEISNLVVKFQPNDYRDLNMEERIIL